MTYSIGDLVKNEKTETFIVLATKTTPLTSNFLSSLNGEILIKGISEIALGQVQVTDGFDYVVAKIESFNGKYCVLDSNVQFTSVFEDNISR